MKLFTLLIPFELDPSKRTPWHPTEDTGPFSILTRGAFNTEVEARAWARSHLGPDATYVLTTF